MGQKDRSVDRGPGQWTATRRRTRRATQPPRSKNGPDGEGTARKTYWAEHNRGRRTEGRPYTEWVREVADRVRHIMGKPPGKLDWEV